MKLNENYDTMSNAELVEELNRRCNGFGDNLPTYVDGELRAKWGHGKVYYGEADDKGITVKTEEDIQDDGEGRLIPSTSRLFRTFLLRFLQKGEFVYYRYGTEAETESQEEALKDIEEESEDD